MFDDYIDELRRKEKDEKQIKKEQVPKFNCPWTWNLFNFKFFYQIRKDFFALLREHTEIERHTHWVDIKKSLIDEPRYKAVTDSILREDYFYDYIKVLKEERKKKKAKKSDKEKKKKKSKDKDRASKEKSKTKADDESGNASTEPSEKTDANKDAEPSKAILDESKSEDDSDNSESEKDDGEHSGTDSENERVRLRQQREEESVKRRQKEVEGSLADKERERMTASLYHKRDEAIRHFTALLADL